MMITSVKRREPSLSMKLMDWNVAGFPIQSSTILLVYTPDGEVL